MSRSLPHGWEWKKVSYVALSVQAGGTPRRNIKDYWDNGTIPWLKISDLKSIYIDISEEKITEKGLNESSAKLFPKGTVVYTIFATLGEVAILNIEATTNQAIAGIIPNNKIIDTKYLYYCLKSEKKNILTKKSHATQDNINLGILRNHEIPVPPLSLQKKIVSILEKAERLKQRRRKANEETNKIIQSVFYEMFGDPIRNEKKWQTKQIKEVVLKTEMEQPSKNYPDKFFKYVDISSVDANKGRIINTSEILGKDAPSRARQKINTNDLLVSTVRPNLNAVALVPDDLDNQICSTGFCILRSDTKKILPEYLFYISRSKHFINSLVQKCKGANYPAVSVSDIKTLTIPIPPINFQNKFASIVEKIESLKEKQEESTSNISNLFDALMQKVFNGELVR